MGYSANLADKLAIPSSKGIAHVVRELVRVIRGGGGASPGPSAPPDATVGGEMEPPAETQARARGLLTSDRSENNSMVIAIACAPRQEVLRP